MTVSSVSQGTLPSLPHPDPSVADLGALGGPEAAAAAAVLRLDDLQQRAERAERRLRTEQHVQERKQIDAQRRADRAALIGGVLEGSLQVASAAVQMAKSGASHAGGSAEGAGEAADGAAVAPSGAGAAEVGQGLEGVHGGAGEGASAVEEAAAGPDGDVPGPRSALRGVEPLLQSSNTLARAISGARGSHFERIADGHAVAAKQASDVAEAHEDDSARADRLADRALGHLEAIANARAQALLAATRA